MMKTSNNLKKLRSFPITVKINTSLRYPFRKYYRQVGFSLTELMTVVAIIGILASIAIPQYAKYQRKARQTEAKLMLSGIYTSNMSFNAEWGYSTPNLYQMGFSPSGDIFYNVGFDEQVPEAGTNINQNPIPPAITDYDGPPPPSSQEGLIDTKTLCEEATYGTSCNFVLTTSSVPIPTNAEVDNTEKYTPKFTIMAVGDLGGGGLDEWKYEVTDATKVMTNEKSGL